MNNYFNYSLKTIFFLGAFVILTFGAVLIWAAVSIEPVPDSTITSPENTSIPVDTTVMPEPSAEITLPSSGPVIKTIVPSEIITSETKSDPRTTIIIGNNFKPDTTAIVNNSPQPTTVISDKVITIDIKADKLVGNNEVKVVNPAPPANGAVSNPVYLEVKVPAPAINPVTFPVSATAAPGKKVDFFLFKKLEGGAIEETHTFKYKVFNLDLAIAEDEEKTKIEVKKGTDIGSLKLQLFEGNAYSISEFKDSEFNLTGIECGEKDNKKTADKEMIRRGAIDVVIIKGSGCTFTNEKKKGNTLTIVKKLANIATLKAEEAGLSYEIRTGINYNKVVGNWPIIIIKNDREGSVDIPLKEGTYSILERKNSDFNFVSVRCVYTSRNGTELLSKEVLSEKPKEGKKAEIKDKNKTVEYSNVAEIKDIGISPTYKTTCTFTNGEKVNGGGPAALTLTKNTIGGTGEFIFEILDAKGKKIKLPKDEGGVLPERIISTFKAKNNSQTIKLENLPAGKYTIKEISSEATKVAGEWKTGATYCTDKNNKIIRDAKKVSVSVPRTLEWVGKDPRLLFVKVSVNIEKDETINCFFSNITGPEHTKKGTGILQIRKSAAGANEKERFALKIQDEDGVKSNGKDGYNWDYSLTNNGLTPPMVFAAGKVTITETPPNIPVTLMPILPSVVKSLPVVRFWTPDSLECEDNDKKGQYFPALKSLKGIVEIKPGVLTTCTLNNKMVESAKLVIKKVIKDINGKVAADGGFNFNIDNKQHIFNKLKPDPENFTVGPKSSKTLRVRPNIIYTIKEIFPSGKKDDWNIDLVECTVKIVKDELEKESPVRVGYTHEGGLSITPKEGETITCTFTNRSKKTDTNKVGNE